MKVNKVILILFFPVMAQLLFSCCCCDEEVVYLPTTYTSEDSLLIALIDNSGPKLKLIEPRLDTVETDSIISTAFGLAANSLKIYYASCKPKTYNFPFINSVYACDCDNYISNYVLTPIKNFKIKTLNNFNKDKNAGSEVTEYFKLFDNQSIQFSEIDSDNISFRNTQNLLLVNAPTVLGEHQFELSFQANDSLVVVQKSPKVILY